MQQISLAQTEEYSNSNSYITSGCGDSINSALFAEISILLFDFLICLHYSFIPQKLTKTGF